jgi:hypothetical protein
MMQPEMVDIQAKYQGADMAKAMQSLYKKHGINPLQAIVPMLVMMPVMMSMFFGVRHACTQLPDMSGGGVLWFTDLTQHDPYFGLPVLGAMTFIGTLQVSSRSPEQAPPPPCYPKSLAASESNLTSMLAAWRRIRAEDEHRRGAGSVALFTHSDPGCWLPSIGTLPGDAMTHAQPTTAKRWETLNSAPPRAPPRRLPRASPSTFFPDQCGLRRRHYAFGCIQ